jgi:hypothetical protein
MTVPLGVSSLMIAVFSSACFGQVTCESKKKEQMTGRDDSGSDRNAFGGDYSPEDQSPLLLRNRSGINWAVTHRICSFGWFDGGFTSAGNASGRIQEAPTPDRFSNQAMLNAAWLTMERPTAEGLSWGFRADFYAGSDAALLRPLNNFGPQGPRWGTDFRQAYLLVHTPLIFSQGIDWTIGRINLPTGAETGLAPYQQLYSRGYFWIHDETGGTALIATLHAHRTLDLVVGTVMGYSTFFEMRGRSPSYIGRVLFHPSGKTKQQLLATVYSGPRPLAATKEHVGRWQTLAELQLRQAWSGQFTQIFQTHYSADTRDPGNGGQTSVTRGAFVISALQINRLVSFHTRLEWFSDPHGIRATLPGNYGEATVGVTIDPKSWLAIRPEIRVDLAGRPSFGAVDSNVRHRNQLSLALELVIKARLF